MISVELKTLFIVYVVLNVLGVVVMASLWRQNRKRTPEIVLWLVYYVMQLVALVLVTLRGTLPDLFSIVFANTLIIGGTVILYAGLARYVGGTSRQWHNYAMVAVFMLIHVYLTFVYPSLALRNVNLSLAFLYIGVQGAWLMLHQVRPQLRPATRATGIVFAGFCLVSLIQVTGNLLQPQAKHLFASGLFGALVILAYQTLFIALTFGLILLVARRLLMDLEGELNERMQTETALRESEEKYRNILHNISEGYFESNLRGDIVYVNDAGLAMMGYQPGEQERLYQTNYRSFTTASTRHKMEEAYRRAYETGESSTLDDYEILHQDGTIRVHQLSIGLIRDAAGNKTGFRSVARDITERRIIEDSLRNMSLATEASPAAVVITDPQGNITYVNRKFIEITGYSYSEVIGQNPRILKSGEMSPENYRQLWGTIASGKTWKGEFHNRKKNGELYWENASISPMIDEKGNTTHYICVKEDITERKRAEELLVAERQRLAYILEGTNVGTWEWNVQTGKTVFNDRWAEMIGYRLAELAPVSIETWMKFAHPNDLAISQDLLERHFRKELPYYECEARMRHKDGHWIWVLDRGKVVAWTEDGKPLTMSGTHQEITARKQAEEQIQHMANHDMLTNLPTMRLARDRLSSALGLAHRHQNMAAVMFIDLDGFKAVNDTLGHDAGDDVLKQVARRLLDCVRETDTVARIGGDEFLLVATELHSSDDAAQIAGKIIHLMSQPFMVNGQQARIGTSIGIAFYPENGKDMDRLIKLADEAMYRVKNSGKNSFTFAESKANPSGLS